MCGRLPYARTISYSATSTVSPRRCRMCCGPQRRRDLQCRLMVFHSSLSAFGDLQASDHAFHAPRNIDTIQSLPPLPSPSTPAFLNISTVESTMAGSTPTTSSENCTVFNHSRASSSE